MITLHVGNNISSPPFTWKKLPIEFYEGNDVMLITRRLLGKIVVTQLNDIITAGRIVEAEAYNGPHDKAAHSYNNRRTNRTEVMYASGGVVYVYLCYGIHQMFNIVTNLTGIPNAILIRAIEPLAGIQAMQERCNKTVVGYDLTRGPGNVAKALGIHTSQSGTSLQGNTIWIADDGLIYNDSQVTNTKRIGVDYAAEDALLPYRFIVKNNRFVSGNRKQNQAVSDYNP